MVWGLLDAVQRTGRRVQSFLSHAYFAPRDGATAITGLPPRHVDSWLMSESRCREVFARGCRLSELAIVEGSFADQAEPAAGGRSDFETLCRWLDLPRLVVVDARLLGGALVERPERVDGLLLDRVADRAELERLRSGFETAWNVPVVGWLGTLPDLRQQIDRIPPGRQPPLELCHALGDELARGLKLNAILRLAGARGFPLGVPADEPCRCDRRPVHVAVAYDESFSGYFPDTLDLLEQRGAEISDFSPLHDERLPAETDVVYIGCGHPERHAAALSKNDCLMLALKSHLCEGRRIYAECGGLAYLCHGLEMPDGHCWPMVGAVPATARFDPTPATPVPTEVRLACDTWLGCAGQCWRGYLSPRWSLRAAEGVAAGAADRLHVVQRQQAVGSRVYLNFAAQAGLVDRFFVPHASSAAARRTQWPPA